jgi:hypothetical protein
MGVKKEDVFTCDNPECRTRNIGDDEVVLPNGFHGTVMRITPSGGSGHTRWYADEEACILPAIVHVLELQ